MLRDFYYLNQTSIDDYLSQLQGYVEHEVEISDGHTNLVKGGINVGAELGGQANHSYGVKKTAKVSHADKFNRFYNLAEKQIKRNLEKAKKGDLIELEATIEVPESVKSIMMISGWIPDASKFMAKEIQNESEPQPEYMNSLVGSFTDKLLNLQSFPVFLKLAGQTPNRLYARLESQWLRRSLSEWQDRELTMLVKIAKFVPKGHDVKVSLVSDLDNVPGLSRSDQKSVQQAVAIDDFIINVHGPAIELRGISIWE